MPTIRQLAGVVADPTLISIFKIGVKRAAYTIFATPNATAPQIAWAKRCLENRADFYASRVLEGAVNEDAAFRAAIDDALENPQSANFTDGQLMTLVTTWVTRFAAADF